METFTQTEQDLVPPALRKQVEELNARIAGQNAEAEGKTVEPAPGQPQAEPSSEQVKETPDQEDTEPTALPNEDAKGQDEPVQQQPPDTEKLDHKFRVLEQKYLKEVPRLSHDLRERERVIAELQRELEDLRKPKETPEIQLTGDPVKDYGLTEQEVEYGPEVLKIAEKVAKKVAQRITDNAIKPLHKQTEAQAFDAYLYAVQAHVPDFNAINNNDKFVDWLDQQEPFAGKTRQQLLQEAAAGRDVLRTVAFFNEYKRQTGAQTQAVKKPSVDVSNQVMPKQAGQAPARDEQKPIFTIDQYKEIMTDLTRGRYLPDRKAQLEKELDAAWREGRVRG